MDKSPWERLTAVATILGLLVAAGGLFFSGLQLKAANEQSRQAADATELQAFSGLNQQINNPTQISRFTTAASHLLNSVSNPHAQSTFTMADQTSILSLSAQVDQMAKLFLLDKPVLPHARELFADEMACVLDDYQTIKGVIPSLHLTGLRWLPTFTQNATCSDYATVDGRTVGFPTGVLAR